MVWAKLDDAILDNPKIAKAGVIGFAMHVAGITWSCRNLKNGFVPTSVVRRLLDLPEVLYEYVGLCSPEDNRDCDLALSAIADLPPLRGDHVAELLVAIGLWVKVDEGYRIHDFLDYNPSKEDVESERERRSSSGKLGAAKRWGTGPSAAPKNGNGHSGSQASTMAPANHSPKHVVSGQYGESIAKSCPVPVPVSEREEPPNPPLASLAGGVGLGLGLDSAPTAARPVRNVTEDGAHGMSVDAWCEGVTDATGLPCTRPTHGQARQMVDSQRKHRPATEEPVAWSRKSAAEYASANAGRELSTFAYCRWLDSGKPSRQAAPGVATSVQYDGPVQRAARKRAGAERAQWTKDAVAPTAHIGALLAAVGAPPENPPSDERPSETRAKAAPARPEIAEEMTDAEREEKRVGGIAWLAERLTEQEGREAS